MTGFLRWVVFCAALCLLPAVVSGQEGQAVKRVLDAEDTDSVAKQWSSRGYQELSANELKKARYAFEQALASDPRSARARFGMGTVHIRMQEYRGALEVLEPMAEEFPDDYSLKNNIAWLYSTATDHSVRNGPRAVALAQDALLLAPRDYHVWSTLAEAYYVSGKYERAVRAAEEALRLAGEQRAAPENIAEYRAQIEKSSKAAEAMSLLE